ncbi:MAG: hypothetical protein KC713_04880, partial [Candidatus Omnitrophica bacterium]|nr:hypothetical protein [Candidatus Omnitrophota bacterium]
MFKTLFAKWVGILFLLCCLLGVMFVAITYWTHTSYLKEARQKLNYHVAEHVVHEDVMIEKGRVNQEALKQMFHMLMVVNPSIELYLIDPKGKVLSYAAPQDKIKLHHVDLKPMEKFLQKEQSLPILGDDPRSLNRQKVFSVAPIVVNGHLEGYIYIILGGEDYDSITNLLKGSYILRMGLLILGVGIFLVMIFGIMLFKPITKRLYRLTQDMADFQKSDLAPTTSAPNLEEWTRGDEIELMSKVFARTKKRIQKQIEEIQNSENLRRELMTNISHDLKTPLTSLQGYIETLLMKQKTLSDKDIQKYLRIAQNQSVRLERLINEL